MATIVLVEDDADIADMLGFHLQDQGFEVRHFADGRKARDYFEKGRFDLVALDIMLPGLNGLDLCRQLREKRPAMPIMMLTSLDSEADRVVGLELGADDYLTKPFSMRECLARIRALLRRCELNRQNEVTQPATGVEVFGELCINEAAHEVFLDNQSIDLTAREFDLLLFLARHNQQVFSRSKLLDAIWGYSHEGYEHTVNTHINRLRKKLKRRHDRPDFIQTVWAVGYKFVNAETAQQEPVRKPA